MTTTLSVVLGLIALGVAFERLGRARDRARWPHPGQMIDVGGHALHVRRFGEGGIPVVFEADEGAWSSHWGRLPEDLGGVQASLAYDRAGLGWSEAGPPPRDAETLARELHQLLTKVLPGQAAVLVGHGTGAHILRAYAHRYPFETAGLVLVDPYADGFGDRLRREQVPTAAASPAMMRVGSLLGSIGLLRLLGSRGSGNGRLPIEARQRATLDALELDPRVRRGAADELAAEPQSLAYLGRIGYAAGDVPVRILTSTRTLGEDEVPPGFPRDDYNRLWADESARFLDLSRRARRMMVEGCGHQIQLERPDVVLEAILDVVDEAREIEARQAGEQALPEPSAGPLGGNA